MFILHTQVKKDKNKKKVRSLGVKQWKQYTVMRLKSSYILMG